VATDTARQVGELGQRFAQAQQRGDADVLDRLLTDDFRLVGPLGLVLDKRQWLDQHRSGALQVSSLTWERSTSVTTARSRSRSATRARTPPTKATPAGGEFRVTQLAVRHDGDWPLAGMHLSPIARRK
jgi:hypothetical protein